MENPQIIQLIAVKALSFGDVRIEAGSPMGELHVPQGVDHWQVLKLAYARDRIECKCVVQSPPKRKPAVAAA